MKQTIALKIIVSKAKENSVGGNTDVCTYRKMGDNRDCILEAVSDAFVENCDDVTLYMINYMAIFCFFPKLKYSVSQHHYRL